MRRIYAAMENELLVIDGVERPRIERRLEDSKPQCVAADPRMPELLYCGTMERGLWRSADASVSWEPVGEGISNTNVTAVAVSAAETPGNGTPRASPIPTSGAWPWTRQTPRP